MCGEKDISEYKIKYTDKLHQYICRKCKVKRGKEDLDQQAEQQQPEQQQPEQQQQQQQPKKPKKHKATDNGKGPVTRQRQQKSSPPLPEYQQQQQKDLEDDPSEDSE